MNYENIVIGFLGGFIFMKCLAIQNAPWVSIAGWTFFSTVLTLWIIVFFLQKIKIL